MKPLDNMFAKMLSPVEVVGLLKPDQLAVKAYHCHSDNVVVMTAKNGDECIMQLDYYPASKNGDVPERWELCLYGEILRHINDNSHFVPTPHELEKYEYYGGYYTSPKVKYFSNNITHMGVLYLVAKAYEEIIGHLDGIVLTTVEQPEAIVAKMLDDLSAHKTNPDGFTNPVEALVYGSSKPRLSLSMSRTSGDNFYRIRVTDSVLNGLPRVKYVATKSMAKTELIKVVSRIYDGYYRDHLHDID